MINEKQIVNKVLEEGQSQSTIGMSLDMDSAQVLMQMLSKNLYSDPIGSTIRECASNALDSHRRAGVTEAIVVSLKVNPQNNYEFSVEDFGTGLDADDVENIISKYGKSTKRESNEYIGMMGLGFKSPLAYSSSFYFVCRKDGIERKYMMYEGEDVNTIDLLYETPTDERNGVKVIVPIKFNDRFTFKDKINNQLAYFESVYFDVNVQNNVITNDFQIHRAEHFQLSEINTDQNLHLCLDNVYYPLDFQKLGIATIPLQIGLRFSLSDGLFPTPNREQLIYSSAAKKTILDKIALVADYFVNKYNEVNLDCKNVAEIFTYYNNKVRNVTIGKMTMDAAKFGAHTNVVFKKPTYPKYKNVDFKVLFKNKEYMFYEYKIQMEYVRGQFRQQNQSYGYSNLSYSDVTGTKRIFIYDEQFVGNKKSYIKSLLPPNDYQAIKFVRKNRKFTLRNHTKNNIMDNYVALLELYHYPRSTWRTRIKEFQAVLAELTEKIEVVDDIAIPQAWLDARKKKRVSVASGGTKRVKLQGEINIRFADELQRYVNGKSSKLTPGVIKVENIESSKQLLVYGKQKDEKLVDELYSVSGKQKIKYIVLSERELKVTQTLDFHNLISIDKFMEGKNKPFKRIITSYLISLLIAKYDSTFRKKHILEKVSKSLYDHIVLLEQYCQKHYHRAGDEDIFKAMLVIAEEHNLFDETIYTEYKQLRDLLDNFPFIDTTMDMLTLNYNKEAKESCFNVLTDLFKYYRLRIDYTNYKLTLNSDPAETIEEDLMDQLTQNS